MGIKGIYREIGPGQRISLCKLAVEKLEQSGRPLRLAIDISIWQFQVQAAKGGANPAIRTLFYRLARLLSHSIQPIFVFDGPNKPAFKRNRRSTARGGGSGDTVSTAMSKRLIRLFGFDVHDAPGEAEAECALLQRRGLVDAVLSEDVDTIMFGCTRTLRNWSSEGTKGSKTPTHVSLYDSADLAGLRPGLDREGMVLVALMSGGDYIPEGVPGCGVKVACEAAKAGFGRSLCRIKRSDPGAMDEWRRNLTEELHDNKSGFFRTRHKALVILDSFPSLEVLRYYTHPVVSQEAAIERLTRSFPSARSIDVQGLREFVAETFDWTNKGGAIKFIRVLAPGLLVQKMLLAVTGGGSDERNAPGMRESDLVNAISKARTHFSTDATPELRVSYIPSRIVHIDLEKELDDPPLEAYGRDGLALNSDDEFEEIGSDQPAPTQGGSKKAFDPSQPDLVWIPDSILKIAVPLTIRRWEDDQRSKELARQQAASRAPGTRTRRAKKVEQPTVAGTMERCLKVTKKVPVGVATKPDISLSQVFSQDSFLGTGIIAALPRRSRNMQAAKDDSLFSAPSSTSTSSYKGRNRSKQPKPGKNSREAIDIQQPAPVSADTNPWTLASSQASPPSIAPECTAATSTRATNATFPSSRSGSEPIIISSSPAAPPPPPTRRPSALKHVRGSPPPENLFDTDDDLFGSPSSPLPSLPTIAASPRKHRSPTTSRVTRDDNFAPTPPRWKDARPPSPSPTPRADRSAGRSAAAVGKKKQQASILGYVEFGESNPARLNSASPSRPQKQSTPVAPLGDECDPKAESSGRRPLSPITLSDDDDDDDYDKEGNIGQGGAHIHADEMPEEDSFHTAVSVVEEGFQKADMAETRKERNTTKLYMPRESAVGYFREVEVTREEADRIMMDQAAEAERMEAGEEKNIGGRDRAAAQGRSRRHIFRRSDMVFVDLTEDP